MTAHHKNGPLNVFLREDGDNGTSVTLRMGLKSSNYVDSRHYNLVFDLWLSPIDRQLFDHVIRTIEDHAAFDGFIKREFPGPSGTAIIVKVKTGSVRNFEKRARDIGMEIIRMIRDELGPKVKEAAAIASLDSSLREPVSASSGPRDGYVNPPIGRGSHRR